MRCHISKNAVPAEHPIAPIRMYRRKNVDDDSSTFRGTWRKPTMQDKPNAHA